MILPTICPALFFFFFLRGAGWGAALRLVSANRGTSLSSENDRVRAGSVARNHKNTDNKTILPHLSTSQNLPFWENSSSIPAVSAVIPPFSGANRDKLAKNSGGKPLQFVRKYGIVAGITIHFTEEEPL
jgi:hypothetical protein